MTRIEAAKYCRESLDKYGLQKWGVRLNSNPDSRYLGLCSYRDEVIILNAEHIDIHPTPDCINTILHEIAHALTPGHGHDDEWAACAKRIGCDNTAPCSNLSLSPEIIDAIRSGADVEVTFDEQVIRTPRYTVTRLQDKCEVCGKVAKEVSSRVEVVEDDYKPDIKFIELECGHTIQKQIPKGTPFHLMQAFGKKDCQHEWGRAKCNICGRCKPYDFQIEGMRFGERALATQSGVGFFDDMGVGKTIQAGGVVKFHKELWPCLWVVKATLTWQTAKFCMNWMGPEFVPQIIANSKESPFPGLKNYIISYDMLVPKVRKLKNGNTVTSGYDISKFDAAGVKCVILDECQMIKNAGASRTQMVRRLVKGKKVIALSGTPWKNRGSELFPVLNMLDHVKFWSEKEFKSRWVDYYWQGNFRKEGGIIVRKIPQFKEFIKDIVIRRERKDVLPELPPVTRTKLYVRLSPQEEGVYDAAVEDFVNWYQEQAEQASGMHILAAMAKMRHLAAIAKIPATLDYVDEFVENTDRKLVIFLHHINVGEEIYQEMAAEYGQRFLPDGKMNPDYIPVIQITGGMDGKKRDELIELFNASPRALMVASTLSSGEGLNLQTGSDCLLHERQWNPANEEQVECRFIRIGQEASVVNAVYAHLEGLTTIDPQLDSIIERKRGAFHVAMNNGEMPHWNQDAMMKELADLIVTAHNAKKNRGKK